MLVCVFVSSDMASETVTKCAMEARELRARQRALASILCERTATSVDADLEQEFLAGFCHDVAQDVLRYAHLCISSLLCLYNSCKF